MTTYIKSRILDIVILDMNIENNSYLERERERKKVKIKKKNKIKCYH